MGYKTYQNKVVIPNQKYEEACALMTEQKYEDAITIFTELDGYKDSASKIDECNQAIADASAAEEAAEKAAVEEKYKKELDEKYKSIIEKIDKDDYDNAIEELSGVSDEETKTQIINYLVDDMKNELSELRASDKLIFNEVHKRCLKVIDIVDESTKEELAKIHDKKCLLIGLSSNPLKSYTYSYNSDSDHENHDYLNDFFDELIEYSNYKDDIDRLNKYSMVILSASRNIIHSYYDEDKKNLIIEDSQYISEVHYDRKNHCLYTDTKKKLYVISGGSESVILGETTDKGIYRLKSNGEEEILSEPIEQDAETFFEDVID